MTPSEILDRAADIMDRKGQCKTDARGIDGSVCIIAAFRDACGRWCDEASPLADARTEAADALYEAVGSIVEFNEKNDKDTVTSTMRAVAATLRASTTPASTVGCRPLERGALQVDHGMHELA